MPTLTEDQLVAAIKAGEIGAITLDTSIFDKYGDNLSNNVLLGLKQFVGTQVTVVFSDIIVSEVREHISRIAAETASVVTKGLKSHRQAWHLEESVEQLGAIAHLNEDPDKLAEKLWGRFADSVHATILAGDQLVGINDLTSRYFSSSPPFSGTGKKKSEFPDAIALLSLESWAEARGIKLLAVTRDGDWESFAEASEHLICLPDVPEALDYFNRAARFIAQRVIALLQGRDETLANAVELFFDDNSMEIEARYSSPYDGEGTLQGASLQSWSMLQGPLILEADEEEITFVVELSCHVHFEASFSWCVYGDNQWHELGNSTDHTADVECPLQFTITSSRKFDEEPVECYAIITSKPFAIDFGYVDPGWDYEE